MTFLCLTPYHCYDKKKLASILLEYLLLLKLSHHLNRLREEESFLLPVPVKCHYINIFFFFKAICMYHPVQFQYFFLIRH